MSLNDRDRHDVEDPTSVGVPRIGQFLVAREAVVGDADLSVYLPSVRAFEIYAIVAVRLHSPADDRVGDLLFGDLLDVD